MTVVVVSIYNAIKKNSILLLDRVVISKRWQWSLISVHGVIKKGIIFFLMVWSYLNDCRGHRFRSLTEQSKKRNVVSSSSIGRIDDKNGDNNRS